MNKQPHRSKSCIRNTIESYAAETIVATVFLIASLIILCYLLGIKFRFNTEYNYDFRAIIVS